MIGELNIPDSEEFGFVKYGNLNHRRDYYPYYRINQINNSIPFDLAKQYDVNIKYLDE